MRSMSWASLEQRLPVQMEIDWVKAFEQPR